MTLGTPNAARVLLRVISELEGKTVADAQLDELRSNPEWLQLPPLRRQVALQRYRVLHRYDRRKVKTKADASAAAAKLGVQLRTFYALLRDWRDKGRTVVALVPYRSDEKPPRVSRLDPEVADRLLNAVRELLARDPAITPGKAVSAIRENWPDTLAPPSAVTMRTYLDRERTQSAPPPGTSRLELDGTPDGDVLTATHFGEVIVVDHTSPSRLMLLPAMGAATTPTITLAIDLWSGSPIGAAVSDREPSVEAVLDALADAQARMAGAGPDGMVKPRVVYACAPEFSQIDPDDEPATLRFERTVIPDHRLPFGTPARTILGSRLATIQLQASPGRRPRTSGIDLDQEALLTLNQMRFLVNASVDAAIQQRLPEVNGRRGARLDLPTSLKERGSLRERVRPLLEVGKPVEVDGKWTAVDGDAIEALSDVPTDSDLAATLRTIVVEAASPVAVEVEVHAPEPGSPGWLVRVEIGDSTRVPSLWLVLARTAIEIADEGGAEIRFDVVANGASRKTAPSKRRRASDDQSR